MHACICAPGNQPGTCCKALARVLAEGKYTLINYALYGLTKSSKSWDLVANPVTQVIGEQALVDILDLSEVAWTCWGVSTPRSGLGLRMVKE